MVLTQAQIDKFRRLAKQRGLTDQQIASEIIRKQREVSVPQAGARVVGERKVTPDGMDIGDSAIFQPTVSQPPLERSIGGFAENVLRSGWETLKGVGGAAINVFNPNLERNTIANLLRLGVGTGELLIPGEQGAEKYARAVGQLYDERYGISNILRGDIVGAAEKTGRTIYEDPVGFALDASIILGGTGAAVRGAGTVSRVPGIVKAGTTLTKAGRVVDPLRAMGRAAGVTRAGERVAAAGERVERFGARQGLRALKAAPTTDVAKFKNLTGNALDLFQKENKLYGTSEQIIGKADDLIRAAQKEYNALVRTGKPVNVKEFTKLLRETAAEMKAGSISPEVKATADALIKRAKFMEKAAGKSGVVPIDKIVEAKGQVFKKVTPATMQDAAALNAEKVAGSLGIEFLEQFAPGSQAIGKRLQALREFRRIVFTRAAKGQGAQAFNVLAPRGVGAAAGSLLGGGIPGAVGGAMLGEFVSSPRGISAISRGIQSMGKGVQRLPELAEQAGGFAIPRAAVASRLVPPTGLEFAEGAVPQFGEETAVPGISGLAEGVQPQLPETTATGHSVSEHLVALSRATAARDAAAVRQIKSQLEIERDYQESQGGGAGKPLSGTNAVLLNKANTALSAVDRIEQSLYDQEGKFQSGKLWSKRLNPFSQEGRQLGFDITSAIDVLGYFRTGAAITIEQRADYIYMFPNELDSAETVKKKIEALRAEFQGYAEGISKAGGDTGLSFTTGQPAILGQ